MLIGLSFSNKCYNWWNIKNSVGACDIIIGIINKLYDMICTVIEQQ